ncbi:MAG: endonuclease/exonuclease/phosphatase family protein [Anaerolineae bacterium]
MTLLQIVTANIGGHRHLNDTPLDTTQIARDVRGILPIDAAHPTLIALQETTEVWHGSNASSDGETLARSLGADYRFLFAPEIDSDVHAHSKIWQRSMYRGYSRVRNGNGIVTNLPIAQWMWSLPPTGYPGAGGAPAIHTTIGRAKLYSSGSRDTQPRNLIVSCLQSPFGVLYFMTTHLSTLRGEERRNPDHQYSQQASRERQFEAGQILALVSELRSAESDAGTDARPIILAGDFNAEASAPEIQMLQPIFTLMNPTPSPDGTHINHKIHIDHILISDPLNTLPAVQQVYVNTAPGVASVTDHRPVIAILGNS